MPACRPVDIKEVLLVGGMTRMPKVGSQPGPHRLIAVIWGWRTACARGPAAQDLCNFASHCVLCITLQAQAVKPFLLASICTWNGARELLDRSGQEVSMPDTIMSAQVARL